jgi:SAM-dependent methyltransferase
MLRDNSGYPISGGDSVAAHAALFDGVAERKTTRHKDVPLDASRQPPARRASFTWFDNWLNNFDLDGRHALDLGCGRGEVSVQLARHGARVSGIDVSSESLSKARRLAQDHGMSGQITLQDGNAENLPFEADTFDLAVSAGVMSFVDFDRVISELARVVRSDGAAVLLDTLGHNPIARLGRKRRLAHGETTKFQVDNILTRNHLDRLRAHFGLVEVHTFDFFTVPMMFVEDRLIRIHPRLGSILSPVSAALRALDRIALKWGPLRRYAFRVVIILKWPRVHESA